MTDKQPGVFEVEELHTRLARQTRRTQDLINAFDVKAHALETRLAAAEREVHILTRLWLDTPLMDKYLDSNNESYYVLDENNRKIAVLWRDWPAMHYAIAEEEGSDEV